MIPQRGSVGGETERSVDELKRQAVFAMSINPKPEGYLHDSTSNVRYWLIQCQRVDFEKLQERREALCASLQGWRDPRASNRRPCFGRSWKSER